MGGYAWVTLATNDAYSLGALVLAHSLRQVGTKHELACLVTPGVTATMREKLAAVFALVQEVNVLDSKDEANLALLARPELGITFTKLHCWRLTQYEKCVFLDADTLVIRNCDELFEREELSAAPDVGWPDCFNSGVFVFKPSQQTFASITAFAAAKGSFDGGDQGLLNMFFSDWATKDISKHLPFIYNLCSTATYSYLPAFKQFGDDVRIIHFIGITKPWLQYFDTLTGTVQPPPGSSHLQPLLQLWWNIFCEQVHPQLSPSMATSTLAPIWHAFTPSSYVPSFSEISDYSDETSRNTFSSRMPDFSEFKDPWEGYSPQTDNASNDKSENCYCGIKYEETADVHQSDHSSATPFAHNQQFYHEQQHSSHIPIQTYDQHQEHTSYSEENRNQEHSVQHTDHHHWQQHSEQRHYVEQHTEQWTDQKHNHEQRHHNEQQHHNEHRQYDEHHQQFYHDYHRNNENNHHQHQSAQEFQSAEIRHESHAYHASDINQTSHQNAGHLNHIISHNESHAQNRNQDVQDTSAPHCWRCNEKNSEQAVEAANKQTDTQRIDFPSPSPAPCTDLHNVAMRSDPNVTEHLDNANTGIAGALAQMTLGEARSSEQVALEEHMRKQSWEQGQIDYMGRDSFDNIWKKICETLSFTPQQQSTPLKEDATLETTVKEIAPKETPEAPADVKVDTPAVEAEKDPTQSLIREISQEEKLSTTQLEQKTPALISEKDIVEEAVTTKAPSEPVQDVCTRTETKPEAVKSCETSAQVPQSLSESLPAVQCELPSPLVCKMPGQEASTPVTKIGGIESTPTEAKSETTTSTDQAVTQPTTPISLDSPQDITVTSKVQKENATKRAIESTPDVTQPLTIDPGEQHAEMLLAASEISTVSPVPIQVAESVLQAEPKESVLGAATVVSDQAIATTVTAVHEPTDITPAPAPIESVQLNGSACEIERRSDAILASSLPEKTDSSTEAAKEPASDLVTTKEISPVIEEKIATSSDTVSLEKSVKESEQVAKSETSETKPVEQIEIEMAELKLSGQTKAAPEKSAEQAEKATSIEAEASEAAARSSSEEVSESPITEQSSLSEGPIDAKLSNVPSTPTVIEATPPTSPSAESAQETEEAKKSLKKSDSTDGAEGESADKKGTKKTVKKITKKPKTKSEEASTAAMEGTAADNSQIHKAKKTVKTTKKTSTKTLETDASVPETPPPPASAGAGGIEAPVPPKRKTKSANTKGKKSEVEE